ncbi:MAG: amylo-alpha-1,6-glucosidase [Polyangia bacterium]
MSTEQISRIGWRRGDPAGLEALVDREWLVTNGLGGYATGTISGAITRRYHGLLVAALPNPLGRTMMFNHLSEQVRLPDGAVHRLGALEHGGQLELCGADQLLEFRLELGLPVWIFDLGGGFILEKRLALAHLQNTVYVSYTLLSGPGAVRLSLRPAVHFRSHDAPVSRPLGPPYTLAITASRFELTGEAPFPSLRMAMAGHDPSFVFHHARHELITYRLEEARGYEARGELWSHGYFKARIDLAHPATLIASTEPWETMTALGAEQAFRYERQRRGRLIQIADVRPDDPVAAELVLAADQFVIQPAGRVEDATRQRAQGEELRTVIAGYHWFTDWGRDTMISLEGLTLTTRRWSEARWILNTFAHYVRDGLIPNMFPEGAQEGLYHTADATLWFFHAIDRYLGYTDDRKTLQQILPVLEQIIDAHRRGTRFGIHVDPADGLLIQGADGYQLTWMDAKCDGWVVTPRRGKAVEINALWWNALRLLARWLSEECGEESAAPIAELAAQAQESFNQRFWYAAGGYLYDVVDCERGGDDPALRPNQIFAVALPNPVLRPERWRPVLDAVTRQLLTPVGLRSLSPDHPDFKPTYHGDLRTRDAAYHQGTVWSWLIGPYVDAWKRVNADRPPHEARTLLEGLRLHLGEACIGSVSEVFDAREPYLPRGCLAQAWGVAELLRSWLGTAPPR